MLTTLGVVEAFPPPGQAFPDLASLSLPNRRFGDTSLLEWVVRRVTDASQLSQVVVVCEEGSLSFEVERIVPPDVAVFTSNLPDPLSRFRAATNHFSADAVVRVQVGSPFIDPVLIDRLVNSACADSTADYVSYCSSDGQPVALSRYGVLAEWCRTAAIERADEEATDPLDRQDVTRFVFSRPDLFSMRLIPVPEQLDRDDLRLGINIEEDWEHAQIIYDALGPEGLEWQTIACLLDQQPEIRARMATLNRAESSA